MAHRKVSVFRRGSRWGYMVRVDNKIVKAGGADTKSEAEKAAETGSSGNPHRKRKKASKKRRKKATKKKAKKPVARIKTKQEAWDEAMAKVKAKKAKKRGNPGPPKPKAKPKAKAGNPHRSGRAALQAALRRDRGS